MDSNKKGHKTWMAYHKFFKIYFGPPYKLPALQTKKWLIKLMLYGKYDELNLNRRNSI